MIELGDLGLELPLRRQQATEFFDRIHLLHGLRFWEWVHSIDAVQRNPVATKGPTRQRFRVAQEAVLLLRRGGLTGMKVRQRVQPALQLGTHVIGCEINDASSLHLPERLTDLLEVPRRPVPTAEVVEVIRSQCLDGQGLRAQASVTQALS